MVIFLNCTNVYFGIDTSDNLYIKKTYVQTAESTCSVSEN